MSSYNISRVLVPIDLSEHSLNALYTATDIAAKHGAEIIVLRIASKNEENSETENTGNVIAALLGSVQKVSGKKPVLISKKGNVADTIVQVAVEEDVNLIVMGSHGASGAREGFIGTNTYQVIKYSTCPVLTIPLRKKVTGFRRVLFPIRPVTGALLRYNVLCHFLSSSTVIDVVALAHRKVEIDSNILSRIISEISDQLETDKVEAVGSWSNGNTIGDDVLRFAQHNNSDLIVISSMVDATSKANFLGPHTQKIIHCSKIPLLSIKKIGVPALA